jgi:uncharacterized protein involved in response to NO
MASVFSALSIALWALQYSGHLGEGYLRGSLWHAHEMLFGYTLAVITGFLFTAVRNWTGQPTPTGKLLAAYAALWLAGRVLVLTPLGLTGALVNAAFPIAVAVGIAVPMVKSKNRRNYFFVALLSAAGIATLAFHLSALGFVAWPGRASLRVGLDLVLFVICVVAGRVVPMFTNNAIPGAAATRKAWLEKAALGSLLALLAADVLAMPAPVSVTLLLAAALLHAARLWLWHPWKTLRTPLVWILHAAYAWIPVHLVLRALAALGLVIEPVAIHALTLGVIGGMTLGMMTRTARGHSGRPLVAGAAEVACYTLVMLAAITRALVPLAWPSGYTVTVTLSAIFWSAAFAIYAVRYWAILTQAPLTPR